MNGFILAVFSLCYLLAGGSIFAQAGSSVPVEHFWLQLTIVVGWTLAGPLVAVLQSHQFARVAFTADFTWRQRVASAQRLSIFHVVFWAVSCTLIFVVTDWPAIVATRWNLQTLPFVFESVLLLPLLVSLIGSWLILFDVKVIGENKEPGNFRNRVRFVMIRIQTHLVAVIAIGVLWVALNQLYTLHGGLTRIQCTAVVSMVALVTSVLWPYLTIVIWNTAPLTDQPLIAALTKDGQQHGVPIRRMRIWKTGPGIINAAATGILPSLRVVLLSEGLVKHFNRDEIAAIVRHELGHIQLGHLPTKLFFVIAPIIWLALDRGSDLGVHALLRWADTSFLHSIGGNEEVVIATGYAVYLLVILRWLSHAMEFEADWFAAKDRHLAKHMKSVLIKLSVLQPKSFERATFFHPSMKRRIQMIEFSETSPNFVKDSQRSFLARTRILMASWMLLLLIAVR